MRVSARDVVKDCFRKRRGTHAYFALSHERTHANTPPLPTIKFGMQPIQEIEVVVCRSMLCFWGSDWVCEIGIPINLVT